MKNTIIILMIFFGLSGCSIDEVWDHMTRVPSRAMDPFEDVWEGCGSRQVILVDEDKPFGQCIYGFDTGEAVTAPCDLYEVGEFMYVCIE